ncbi:hypothetical protein L210DRAFT_3652903 [Boletus edulis BED1]|uniref:Uncharacterized protein n=1 Tax=Boletus edulis BED1 TaxID=1328754 RepID=A0AAD4BF13_BOLED|nr:hypothetical protein L210DRAFT_3652903 [Boletus edulis BED1]
MHLPHAEKTAAAFIPKFHLPAHVRECQRKCPFNYVQGGARTGGEAPERGWSALNAAASSTKEMGPGHRHDTLDGPIGDSNWKMIRLGESILRKVVEAIPERNEHEEGLREFKLSLSARYAKELAGWKEDAATWEQDASRPNPFEVKSHSFTQASIRLQLANDEAKLAIESAASPMHLEISPSMLVNVGIEPEDQQLRYTPSRIICKLGLQLQGLPETTGLHSQASIFDSAAGQYDISPEEAERKLRLGQARDALAEIRQALRSRSYMLRFKGRFLRGQGANTRARNCLKSVDTKADASAAKYCAAHSALLSLSPLLGKVGWMNYLRYLEKDDARSMADGTEDRASEGRRKLSWIRLTCGYSGGDAEREDEGLQGAIRIGRKVRARAHRWAEEVELLFEEQRRVLRFLRWQAKWRTDRQNLVVADDSAINEGLGSYALRQAALRDELAKHFTHIWRETEGHRKLLGGTDLAVRTEE